MPETQITIQAQSTAWERVGSLGPFGLASKEIKGYDFVAGRATAVSDAILNAALNSAPKGTLCVAEQSFLEFLLTKDPQCLPGGMTLKIIQALTAETFSGSAGLKQIYEQDPFSQQYEDRTISLYERQYLVARSVAQSGPLNVRGGTERTGFELAELDTLMSINRFREVWQNQLAVAELVINAVQAAGAIEASRRSDLLNSQRLQAATEQGQVQQMLSASELVNRIRSEHTRANAAGAEFLSIPFFSHLEAMQGQGFQQGVTTSFGSSYWR